MAGPRKTTLFAISHDLMKRQNCMAVNADTEWQQLAKSGGVPKLSQALSDRRYLWGSLNTNMTTLLGTLPQEFQPIGSSGNTIPPGKGPLSTRVKMTANQVKQMINRLVVIAERFEELAQECPQTAKEYKAVIKAMDKLWDRAKKLLSKLWAATPKGAKPDDSETGKP